MGDFCNSDIESTKYKDKSGIIITYITVYNWHFFLLLEIDKNIFPHFLFQAAMYILLLELVAYYVDDF